jgi:hypothetical protein
MLYISVGRLGGPHKNLYRSGQILFRYPNKTIAVGPPPDQYADSGYNPLAAPRVNEGFRRRAVKKAEYLRQRAYQLLNLSANI